MNKHEYDVNIYEDGDEYWYKHGTVHLHRLNGPACKYAGGSKIWYKNGKLHRLDGPACECASGTKLWYIDGIEYTEAEFNHKINPAKELTVAELEKILGYTIKIVK